MLAVTASSSGYTVCRRIKLLVMARVKVTGSVGGDWPCQGVQCCIYREGFSDGTGRTTCMELLRLCEAAAGERRMLRPSGRQPSAAARHES